MSSKYLDQAIELHEEHMEHPKTATVASQKKLMDLLLKHKQEMEGGMMPLSYHDRMGGESE